jgi:hypothetical protein
VTAADTTTDAIIAALENHFAQQEKKLESANQVSGATRG